MRLSEAIIIYLAAGASFGVYQIIRRRACEHPVGSLLKASRAAILWPLTAAKILTSHRPQVTKVRAGETDRVNAGYLEKIAQAERRQHASLQSVLLLTQDLSGRERAQAERAFRSVREIVERYVGLTLAAAESDPHALPSERELELCRLAGRRGEELWLAGRCIHRRNVMRLIKHQARARTELLHALAEIGELSGSTTFSGNVKAARHLSVVTVRFYSHVFNLLSLLEDKTAASGVARLLDSECGKLRRLEALNLKEMNVTEEEPCKRHALHPVFNGQSPLEATNQRG